MVLSNFSDGGGISEISIKCDNPVVSSGSFGGFKGEAPTGKVWKVDLKSAPYECKKE